MPKPGSAFWKRMKELNYQPNMMARGLASGHTYTVGLVVPDLVHPFFAEFAKSLSGSLRTSNRASDTGILRRGSRDRTPGDQNPC